MTPRVPPALLRCSVAPPSEGLAVALEGAGFEVVELGVWGNADYAQKLFANRWWPALRDLAQPVVNDPMVPCGVWALARRPNH